MALVEIEDLRVEFGAEAAPVIAVDGIDLTLDVGEVVGCVGESGSGKSVTALALMGLVEFPGRVRARRLAFAGRDLLALSDAQRRALVGKDMAMIFQDPLASLNPCFTVAFQLTETLRIHGSDAERVSARLRWARALELLRQVEIPDAQARLAAFPHQLSGGMALLLITHDLAVVAETAQRVFVMYAGQVVETGAVPQIFEAPVHPYTQALLAALPEHNRDRARLKAIPGVVPGQHDRPVGCLLHPRCDYAVARCRVERPPLAGPSGRQARCHFPLDAEGRPTRGWRPEPKTATVEE